MAPRSRLRKNAGLPPNLYVQDGYYTYRNPQTKEVYGLGRNKAQAVTQAIEANLHFQKQAATLLDRITGNAGRTVADWCDQCSHHRMKYLREGLGHYVLSKLTPLQISEWLDEKWADKPRMRQAMLSCAKKVLGAAIGKGWITYNPAADLDTPTPKTMRDRLTLAEYRAIYDKAEKPLQFAMTLALMTCARRENIINLRWTDIEDGYLHIAHVKAKEALGEEPMKVRYPLSMYLPELKLTLGDAIARCRDNVVSPYLIHHNKHQGQAKPGHKFRDKTIEQWFRETRDAAGVKPREGRTPPTFHEIKSLAKGLWDAHGYNTQAMCGHKTERMGDLYRDRRGKEWVTVSEK